jgi:hypothetical protein
MENENELDFEIICVVWRRGISNSSSERSSFLFCTDADKRL